MFFMILRNYQTKDGKVYPTQEKAESACLENAHNLLGGFLKSACPSLEPKCYKIAQDIISYSIQNRKMNLKRLQNVVALLEDTSVDNSEDI